MNPLHLPRGARTLWLATLGAGALAVAASGWPGGVALLVWLPAFVVGELFWVRTAGRRGTISTSMLVHLAAVALLPAGQAVAPAAAVALWADLRVQRKPWVKAAYNAALLAVTLWAAGAAFHAGEALTPGPSPALAGAWLALAGVVYWVVNRAGVVAIVALAEGIPWTRAWQENFLFGYEVLVSGVKVVLAWALVALWPRMGPLGLAGLGVLCFFLNDSYRRRNRLEELQTGAEEPGGAASEGRRDAAA
ncbi:MAG TPA: hypothetical protein VMS93_00075 [Candidatus Saccharimonadales bacterium]|nr:hypothetical protein [Candidatus Saccharimonadales bacterium]